MELHSILHSANKGLRSLFPSHLARELKELYTTAAFLSFANSSFVLFEPIYLYTLGYPLWGIMAYYCAVYVGYFFTIPLGGRFVKRYGFEHGMMLGSLFQILYYLSLYCVSLSPWFLPVAVAMYILQKTFFWPGYHSDFAMFGHTGERGREISNLAILDSLVVIVGPVFGGLIIGIFGFPVLFLIVSVIVLLSNIPIMMTRETFTPSEMKYWDSFKELCKKENRPYTLGNLGYGEELIVLTVWPVFIYTILGSAAAVGSTVAAATLVSGLIVLYVGKAIDGTHKKSVLRLGVLFYVLAWLFRLMVGTISGVFLVDFFARTSKQILSLPILAGLYDHAIRTTHVVRAIIAFEMSLVIGKILASGGLLVVFFLFGEQWRFAFALAAVFSLCYLGYGYSTSKNTFKKPAPIFSPSGKKAPRPALSR